MRMISIHRGSSSGSDRGGLILQHGLLLLNLLFDAGNLRLLDLIRTFLDSIRLHERLIVREIADLRTCEI